MSKGVLAAAPDLTAGGVPTDTVTINLGATGLRGWVYHVGASSSESRQIQVATVDTGSPSAGILAVNDVILGASGTGANPVNFTSDARKSLALAIADAEAANPGILQLIRWRAGSTATVQITLRTMGAYSATAPYNCPKSAKILEEGLQYVMTNETAGSFSLGTLTLLAANDPTNSNNAARQTRAQTEARALIPSATEMALMNSDVIETSSKIAWTRGHQLIVLAEYYLKTGDAQVLPALQAYVHTICKGQSLFGTMGHLFAEKWPDGSPNGPMGGGYGVVNSAGLPCFFGLTLAKQCGITDAGLDPAIERASRFFASYANKGAIPYGEHEPYETAHESNGKSGLAALTFALLSNRMMEGKFFTQMATASTTEREIGHTGPFFNYLWAPLGANVGGQEAAVTYFNQTRWLYDLARRWNGSFAFDAMDGSGSSYSDFRMSTAALLTYAMPLQQLHITGRNQNSNRWLSSVEVSAAVAADQYNAPTRSTANLVSDLGSWSPKIQRLAADQLATRTTETTALLPTLTALANDTNGTSRVGACYALGKIANSSSAATLAALLTDPANHVRFTAAEGLRYLSQTAKMSVLNTILSAAASTAKPLTPFDEEDPLHMAHGRIGVLLFYSGNAYGPKGMIWGTGISGVDRNLLYPAIRAIAASPIGFVRSTLTETYRNLTQADTLALADSIVDSVGNRAPADKMFSTGVRQGGLDVLQKYDISEGVPLSMIFIEDENFSNTTPAALGVLQLYAGSSKSVLPDPDVVGFLQEIISGASGDTAKQYAANAQAVLNAIAADTNPAPLTAFKVIQSATADSATLTLPSKYTVLRLNSNDYAKGDSIYTWRKVSGAGSVSFTPNGTGASKNTTVLFDGTPGHYVFEVKMSDSRGLTEVYKTVAVTLYNSGGTLPANNPPTANAQSPTVGQATPTPITLTGSDPEGYELAYSVSSQPSHGTLTGTAPYLVYTSDFTYTGPDSFTFQVTDSEGQASSATVNITVAPASGIGLGIYEPFNYTAGALNGKSGSSEVGLTGTWSANTSAQVVANSLPYGTLPTLGGSVGNLNGGSNNYGGTRAVSTAALASNGLLSDGSTLWFSVVVGYGSGGNLTNSRLAFALANSNFGTNNGNYSIANEGSQLGSGLGITLGRFNSVNGKVVATQFRDASFTTASSTNNVFGTVPGTSSLGSNSQRFVVGKITWGAASDTIELYEPDANLNLGPVTSTLTVNVNQSTFDSITWTRGDVVTMDEIRFGPNSYSVQLGSVAMSADIAAPTPNPVGFRNAPAPSGTTSIRMVAVTVYDPNSVEYYFTCTAGGGHNSGWQDSPTYTDTGLTPGVQYGYTVKARDKSPAQNVTTPSAAAFATIAAQTTVPNMVGMIQSTAQSILATTGLTTGTVTSSYSNTIPSGNVISQTPGGDTSVSLGTSVNLAVSLGIDPAEPPLLSSIVDDQGGISVVANTLVTYTLTFTKDMNTSTVNAADFSNAGTSAVTIGTITKISAGVFNVQITPTNTGTLRLQVSAGATLNDVFGVSLNTSSAILDDNTLVVTSAGGIDALIYEPFNYASGTSLDVLTPNGAGLAGLWTRHSGSSSNELQVGTPGMSYGLLPAVGNRLLNTTTGGGRANNVLIGNTLVNAGLLADGATLWFSILVKPVTSSNSTSGFGLADGNATSYDSVVNAVGINVQNGSDLEYWSDVRSSTYSRAAAKNDLTVNAPQLVVGKLVWGTGGGNDTFEIFLPDTNLIQGSRYGALQSINVNQSTFDRIVLYNSGGGIEFDEIRFGATYASVTGSTVVPGLVGLPQATAQANILTARLTLGTVTSQNSATVPAGKVISHSPVAGASVSQGSAVNLVVSLGPVMTTVPNVVDIAQTTAESNITTANLVVGTITSQHDPLIPSGKVISQSLAAGSNVAVGSAVNLVISSGPVMVTVPNLVGLAQTPAEQNILAVNLAIGTETTLYSDTVPAGDVISQNPAQGSSVIEATAVNLVISLGVAPDTTPPTVTSIVDNKSGGPVTVGTSVTYTVTFSEDMDATTVTAAVFGNAGTANVTIGTVTETTSTSGVFTVQATPTATGSLRLKINASAILKDAAGNNLNTSSEIADDTIINVITAYANWSGGAAFGADANGDGVANGLAWALGAADSNANATNLLPTVSISGGNMTFTFKRSQASINANTAVTIEVGTALGTWPSNYTVGATTASSSSGVTVAKDSPASGTDTVTLSVPQAPDAKKFARLKVVQAP